MLEKRVILILNYLSIKTSLKIQEIVLNICLIKGYGLYS